MNKKAPPLNKMLATELYLYQMLHLYHGRVRLLDRHVELLDRCVRELFGTEYRSDLRTLERQVLATAAAARYPSDISAFVRIELTAAGEVRLLPAGVSYYGGYALRSVRPAGVSVRCEPPLDGYPTQARDAAVTAARRMAECAGGRVAVQHDADGTYHTIEGSPLAVVREDTVWLAPEGRAYEIPASGFRLGEGALRGCRFDPPHSVEYGLLAGAVQAAGLTLREEAFDAEVVNGADELFWLDHRGVTALSYCDGRPLMALAAERIAAALEKLFVA